MKTRFVLLLSLLIGLSGYVLISNGQSQKAESTKVVEVKRKPKTDSIRSAPAPVQSEPTALDTLNQNILKLDALPDKIDDLGTSHNKTRKQLSETDLILDSIAGNITTKKDTQTVIIIVDNPQKIDSILQVNKIPVKAIIKKKRFWDRINIFK